MTRLLLVVADGVRPDVLRAMMDSGNAPALAALRERGGLHTITSSFPSVTGPAYVPFLMGRHAANVGMPGLRWFDRSGQLRRSRRQARSYAGVDIWQLDHDVAPTSPTLFDLARPSLSGMSMLGRGASIANVGRSFAWSVRAAVQHFRGDLFGWRRIEQRGTNEFFHHFAAARPRFATLAITSPDKFAHKFGADCALVHGAIQDVDAAVARAGRIATEGGWGDSLRIWVVSDHGHADVSSHDDLHDWLETEGWRIMAHPTLRRKHADIALMVGGNAMAHLYLEPSERTRRWWPSLAPAWTRLHDALVLRDSVDLVAVALDAETVQVTHALRGTAVVRRQGDAHCARWSYQMVNGDALLLGGPHTALDDRDAWTLCSASPYPDALVQLQTLAASGRSGDIILSAAPDWDLRARHEPVPHVSTHGALLREQMLVPLLIDGPVTREPQRTADVMPSVLQALQLPIPDGLDGRSFV
jgi:hypothetical protein